MVRSISILSVVSLMTMGGFAHARLTVPNGLPNLNTVNDHILRGGRPDLPEGLQYLEQQGIKTIINLENDDAKVSDEMRETPNYNLNELSWPLHSLFAPSDSDVNSILRALQDTDKFPIYLHCQHGQDRTGLIIGLYRVEVEGWTPEDAYQEMLSNGFHPVLLHALKEYFEKRTGMN